MDDPFVDLLMHQRTVQKALACVQSHLPEWLATRDALAVARHYSAQRHPPASPPADVRALRLAGLLQRHPKRPKERPDAISGAVLYPHEDAVRRAHARGDKGAWHAWAVIDHYVVSLSR